MGSSGSAAEGIIIEVIKGLRLRAFLSSGGRI